MSKTQYEPTSDVFKTDVHSSFELSKPSLSDLSRLKSSKVLEMEAAAGGGEGGDPGGGVITSYSIHYTKLYEATGIETLRNNEYYLTGVSHCDSLIVRLCIRSTCASRQHASSAENVERRLRRANR